MQAITKTNKIMLTSKDYEKLWNRYQSEGVAHNLTLQQFCSMNNVAYNSFEKYLKTRRNMSDVYPVTVTDMPEDETPEKGSSESAATNPASTCTRSGETRILVSIKMTNGLYISKGNLSYRELHALVEKLEVLC